MKSEFSFIKSLQRKQHLALSIQHSAIIKGIGDDAAIIKKDSTTDYVISTDLLVEDIDFRLEWTQPDFLGHKALAVSLSDIAAMGANPIFALLSIGIPKKIWHTKFLDKFYDGWFALSSKHNVQLIGGDVSKTPDKIVIDSIVIGETKHGKAVMRSGAKVGDLIFVTGNLGGASAGLRLLEDMNSPDISKLLRSKRKSDKKFLILKQLKPDAKVEIGKAIGEKKLATSMIDISDGLSSDLNHLCNASNVCAVIESDKIPIESLISTQCSDKNDQLNFAINGGEDFELLFTVNPNKVKKLFNSLEGCKITQIGVITEKTKNNTIIINGKKKILRPKGFVHF